MKRPPARRYIGRVDEVADRWLRRYTGPWRSDVHSFGPLAFEHRYRYRPRIEFVRFWIATQHAWHATRADLRRLLRWLTVTLTVTGRSGGVGGSGR
jgi:hypothetical protein